MVFPATSGRIDENKTGGVVVSDHQQALTNQYRTSQDTDAVKQEDDGSNESVARIDIRMAADASENDMFQNEAGMSSLDDADYPDSRGLSSSPTAIRLKESDMHD